MVANYPINCQQGFREACKWFKKAAEQGDVDAQNNLGEMYYFGYGIDQDTQKAITWYRKAADQGSAEAQRT